jgi:hypothetical protein
MSNFLKKNKFNLIRFILLIPILMVAVISISHVVSWYEIANPFKWAVYLSISVEIAAMVSILSFSLRMKGGAWAIFFIVTFIQMIGNIFFSFKEIDSNGDLFKSWVELTGPLWEMMGSDPTDVVAMKRWLAFLEGGLLPIISLTSLHFFVKYDGSKVDTVSDTVSDTVNEVVSEGVSEGVNLDDEGVLAPNSITNSTYEITKEIFESNEKSESLSDVETFLDESQYLNLQESDNPVIETTETISDDIREIIDEVITTENTKFPMDMMLEFEDDSTTTTTTDDGVRRLSYAKTT